MKNIAYFFALWFFCSAQAVAFEDQKPDTTLPETVRNALKIIQNGHILQYSRQRDHATDKTIEVIAYRADISEVAILNEGAVITKHHEGPLDHIQNVEIVQLDTYENPLVISTWQIGAHSMALTLHDATQVNTHPLFRITTAYHLSYTVAPQIGITIHSESDTQKIDGRPKTITTLWENPNTQTQTLEE